MVSRREFMQGLAAAAATGGSGIPLRRLAAGQRLSQADLLDFAPFGNVTLAHITDIHAQLKPVWFREPSVNLGVGAMKGLPPHVTGPDYLKLYGLDAGSPEAHALTYVDFVELAKTYGRMGGMDRVATIIAHMRAERAGNLLLLDGGDSWQGSYTALKTNAQDVVDVMTALGVEAMTGHWEFTLGAARVKEIVDSLPFPFLGANIFDKEWQEPAFPAMKMFERGGVKIAVIGQAFPYTPIANPGWLFPDWSFGIREDEIARHVAAARAGGAGLVVLLSHNGFDVDRKLASRVEGIDVILTGHTHDALPVPEKVGRTLLVATGSNGKFVSRLDLDVAGGGVRDYRYRLIPVFADVIAPDADMAALIDGHRAPFGDELERVVGHTDSLLYRRGNFNGTMDDLFCDGLMAVRDAEIALSPGFRWGPCLLPGDDITVEDLYGACAITYPAVYRSPMTGQLIKDIMEDVADNLFNPDPYYQQGGDMVRLGGMSYAIDTSKPIGERIASMTLLRTGEPIDADRDYVVAGWASVNQATEGPAIWDVMEDYLKAHPAVKIEDNATVKVTG
jgi:sulfur-oxidizing protein SoxB